MEFCDCKPCDQRHVVDAYGVVVCLNCWSPAPERRSQFRDRTTWTPEFRAGVLAALDIRNRVFLAQCEELFNKSK